MIPLREGRCRVFRAGRVALALRLLLSEGEVVTLVVLNYGDDVLGGGVRR